MVNARLSGKWNVTGMAGLFLVSISNYLILKKVNAHISERYLLLNHANLQENEADNSFIDQCSNLMENKDLVRDLKIKFD